MTTMILRSSWVSFWERKTTPMSHQVVSMVSPRQGTWLQPIVLHSLLEKLSLPEDERRKGLAQILLFLGQEWWGLLAPETAKNCWEQQPVVTVRNQKVSRWVNLLSKLGDEYEIMDLKISISQLWTNRRFISVQRVILAVLWPRNMMQQ